MDFDVAALDGILGVDISYLIFGCPRHFTPEAMAVIVAMTFRRGLGRDSIAEF